MRNAQSIKYLVGKSSELVLDPFPDGAGVTVEAMEVLGAAATNGPFLVKALLCPLAGEAVKS